MAASRAKMNGETKQREENQRKRRRKIIEERIFKKRLPPDYKIEQKASKALVHEESEGNKEEVMSDNLTKHKQRAKDQEKVLVVQIPLLF